MRLSSTFAFVTHTDTHRHTQRHTQQEEAQQPQYVLPPTTITTNTIPMNFLCI